MSFEKTYQVNFYNCGQNLRLSITSMLRFFEDFAITHSEAGGLGFLFYLKNNIAWFLSRWFANIESLPQMS